MRFPNNTLQAVSNFALLLLVCSCKLGGASALASPANANHKVKSRSVQKSNSGLLRFSFSTRVTAFALSPDGKILACANEPKLAKDWPTRWVPNSFQKDGEKAANSNVNASNAKGVLSLWDTRTRKLIHKYFIHTLVNEMRFSPDGKLLLCEGDNYALPLKRSPDGEQFVRVWNVGTGRFIHQFGFIGDLLAFSPNGHYCVIGTLPKLSLYETKPWRRVATFNWSTTMGAPTELVFSPDSQQLAELAYSTEGSAGSIHVWNIKSKRLVLNLGEENDDTISGKIRDTISFLNMPKRHDGKPYPLLITGDSYIYVTSTAKGYKFSHIRLVLGDRDFGVLAFHIGHPRIELYSPGSFGPSYELWNIDTKKKLTAWNIPKAKFFPSAEFVMFSANGKKLAFKGEQEIWVVNSGKFLK